jgi:tRNA(Ile)-lysidine synthase
MNSMPRLDLALEQKVLRGIKSLTKPPRRLLLAVSGGLDSLVMAEILWKWRTGLRLELAVAHIHHGPAKTPAQTDYRQRAQEFVRAWAAQHDLEFFTNAPRILEQNEKAFREFREEILRNWSRTQKFAAVAMAHHQDDLLETRLLRLIRGSGHQGLRAMSIYRYGKLRPLLLVSRREIFTYARAKGLQWVEDPSNRRSSVMRNWVRRQWLPALETRSPGASQALARSLETIAPEARDFDLAPYVGLRRDVLQSGPLVRRRALVAQYLKGLGLNGYARTHVDEILKRLSSERGDLAFVMLGIEFRVSREFLWASRV